MHLVKQLSKPIKTHILLTATLCALYMSVSTLTVRAQAADRKPAAGYAETAHQEGQAGGILDVLEPKKTAIVGSWLGTVGSGDRIVQTFNADGTAHNSVQSEVSTDPAHGVLTPLHGVWTHLGGRQFGATFMGIFYDINTGQLSGYLKVRLMLTLNEAGDEMSGNDQVEILDTNGNVVLPLPEGNTSYKRIKFEPFK
jgi:hypothetical protein